MGSFRQVVEIDLDRCDPGGMQCRAELPRGAVEYQAFPHGDLVKEPEDRGVWIRPTRDRCGAGRKPVLEQRCGHHSRHGQAVTVVGRILRIRGEDCGHLRVDDRRNGIVHLMILPAEI